VIFKNVSSIYGNVYRVTHLKEPLENQYEDGVSNVMQTFCGLKEIGINGQGVMAKMPTMCNTCVIVTLKFYFHLSTGQTAKGNELKLGMCAH